jgi:hypothetical protein
VVETVVIVAAADVDLTVVPALEEVVLVVARFFSSPIIVSCPGSFPQSLSIHSAPVKDPLCEHPSPLRHCRRSSTCPTIRDPAASTKHCKMPTSVPHPIRPKIWLRDKFSHWAEAEAKNRAEVVAAIPRHERRIVKGIGV